LPRRFFERPVVELAEALIGQVLVRRRGSGRRAMLLAGRIVETEAYGGQGVDPSAHSFRGPTPRCAVMFGPAGHAYVYSTHQGRCCLNVTAEGDDRGKAVLLRAIEPLRGEPAMRALRLAGLPRGPTRERLLSGAARELGCGPARLCACLAVDRALDGLDLTDARSTLFVAAGDNSPFDSATPRAVVWGPRVGLNPKSASCGWLWRARLLAPGARRRTAEGRGTAGALSSRPRPRACPDCESHA
ncbi:MAG TPA: DNA-3-methyladenine glycosylase, partial [Planctomycetota bacterium]|nr:DNA-3-methyladenine glycosylase [Planctomycetota bacterium]